MWVKICANTNLEDALLAAQLGADAVGFVFAPSARQVTPAQAAAMTPHLPAGLSKVGVFPAWTAGQIRAAVRQAGLTAVQLHAAFDPTLTRSLRDSLPATVSIIQAVHWSVDQDESAAAISRQLDQIERLGIVDRILIDAKVGNAAGGAGVPFDWNAAQSIFARQPGLILAGGLNPHNVLDAIGRLRPWGVDVASGVEERPGGKSKEKLAAFLAAARRTSPV